MERRSRKVRVGTVIGDKKDKTRIVKVSRSFKHSLYQKVLKQTSKYYVHDKNSVSHIGDKVKIMETRPISKLKRWCLLEVINKASI